MSLSVLIPVGELTITDPWRSRALSWLQLRYAALLPEAEVMLGTSPLIPFSRSAARNDAFRRSSGDVLLVADADTAFNRRQIDAGLGLLEEGAPWVICYREGPGYYLLTEAATDTVLALPVDAELPEPPPGDWTWADTSWAGMLLVSREAWEKVGGYDERFIGWGFDDNAFRFALDNRVGPHRRVDDFVVHLHHERTAAENFEQPYIERNRRRCHQYEIGLLP